MHPAGVAELVDAPGLGPGGSNPVEVQVLSPAQENDRYTAVKRKIMIILHPFN